MAEEKIKELEIERKQAERLVRLGVIDARILENDNILWKLEPRFTNTQKELLDSLSLDDTINFNDFNTSLGGFINKCIYGPIFPSEIDYRDCDRIRIYYPDPEVSKKFVNLLRYNCDKYKNMPAKIYTDRNEFQKEVLDYKKSHRLFNAFVMTCHYLNKDKDDLCIDLEAFEGIDFENKDLSNVNFYKEYNKYIKNGENYGF